MKNLLFSLITVMAGMSINAQQVRVLMTTDNGSTWSEVQTFRNKSIKKYKVVFEKAPAITLPGKFSVSGTKQIQFTNGNLYYSTTDNKYHIEPEQNVTYITLGQKAYDATHVCHFYWVNTTDWQTSGKEPWAANYSYSTRSTSDNFFCCEDNKMTIDGLDGLYCLSMAEYNYIFKNRTNASNLYKCGVSVTTSAGSEDNCIVIAPDDYTGAISEAYTAEEWLDAEDMGLVCLPAGSYRKGDILYYDQYTFPIWSGSQGEFADFRAYAPSISPDGYYETSINRNDACPIRLVKGEDPSKGKAEVSESAGISGNKVQWVQLWDNGPKWAVFNVGAKSVGEYGGYYNWGKSVDKATDDSYSSSTSDIQGTSDDTAKNLWGGNWQMPTKTDYDNLLANCDVILTTQNGLSGRLYTGKNNYSSNSVFFPASGYCSNAYVDCQDVYGHYWSSTPTESGCAYHVLFNNSDGQFIKFISGGIGFSVRAILKE